MLKLIDVAWNEFDMPASENPNKVRELGKQWAEREISQHGGSNALQSVITVYSCCWDMIWEFMIHTYIRVDLFQV